MLYFLLSFAGFLIASLLISLQIKHASKWGLIDYPNERSMHTTPLPTSGGCAIFLTLLIIQIFLRICGILPISNSWWSIIIGATLITFMGVLDDKYDLPPFVKLFVEIIIALAMYYCGFRVDLLTNPFGTALKMGIFSVPITVIWFLAVMNSINLIDGVDGLAIGIISIGLLTLGISAIVCDHYVMIYWIFPLFGACLAFLRFNFYPAKIFLGDAGSLSLGFLIAALSIAGNKQFKGATAMTLLIPFVVLLLPFLDTFLAIGRRIKRTQGIFTADKGHIHHRLLKLGLSHQAVAGISYFITMLFALISLGFLMNNQRLLVLLIIILGFLILGIIYALFKQE